MFRIRKTGTDMASEADTNTVEASPPPSEETITDAAAAKPPIRRVPQAATRLPVTGAYTPDPSRKPADLTTFPARTEAATAPRERALLAGKDVRLKGEISDCDRVVIDGVVDLDITKCKHLQVGATGVFKGSAEVQEADLAGRVEGNLVVHERLMIRPTGHVIGTIRYGTIQIEAGGDILGDVSPIAGMATIDAGRPASSPSGAVVAVPKD